MVLVTNIEADNLSVACVYAMGEVTRISNKKGCNWRVAISEAVKATTKVIYVTDSERLIKIVEEQYTKQLIANAERN